VPNEHQLAARIPYQPLQNFADSTLR